MYTEHDEYWMQKALKEAECAELIAEVPVGAVLVMNDEIIGSGFNCPILKHDPTAHAEIMALRDAGLKGKNYRLPHSTLYVTLEPCIMCVGAILHARIERIVFGAPDLKAGAIVSKLQLLNELFLNHRIHYFGGILAEQCGSILSKFFQERRTLKCAQSVPRSTSNHEALIK